MVVGLALPVLALLLRGRLGQLEAGAVVPERPYSLLRGLPMFAPLPIATIENLATRAESEEHPAGTEIIRQGEDGERFYVIDEGTLDVVADGHLLAHRGAGECVGEIALLRAQPRMATVRATTPVRLVAARSQRLPRRGLRARPQYPRGGASGRQATGRIRVRLVGGQCISSSRTLLLPLAWSWSPLRTRTR